MIKRDQVLAMIYRLEIENFYSVRERQVIDLTVGAKVPDEPGRLVPIHTNSTERAPRVVAIYGPNAAGKSNILRAISFISFFVSRSFNWPSDTQLPYLKFASHQMAKLPTKLSVTFEGASNPLSQDESESCPYTYSVELLHKEVEHGDRKAVREQVIKESLYYKPPTAKRMVRIFDRDAHGKLQFGSLMGSGKELKVAPHVLREDASAISTLAQLNNAMAQHLRWVAESIFSNILVSRYEHDTDGIAGRYEKDEALLFALNRDIQRIDLGVSQIDIIQTNGKPTPIFFHTGLSNALPLFYESQGTQQFFKIFPSLYDALHTGGVAVVDELDAAIHPNILPEVLRWFYDPQRNPHGAQLWMSCHAVSLMEDLLREQVLLCEKSSTGSTEVYALADIKGTRRNDNIAEKYVGGLYGAVPVIG